MQRLSIQKVGTGCIHTNRIIRSSTYFSPACKQQGLRSYWWGWGGEQRRLMQHQAETPEEGARRAHRPLSPHLTIYQPQLTWLMSIGHRITGAGLATLIYGFGIYYAVLQPGPGLLSTTLLPTVAGLPTVLVMGAKFVLSAPLFYHLYNGIRHLVWDLGHGLTLRGVYIGGWLVNVASIATAAVVSII